MAASLWEAIDAALVAAVQADMGLAVPVLVGTVRITVLDAPPTPPAPQLLDGVDLGIRQILVGETINPSHVDLPMVLIRGYDVEYAEAGPHADGEIHIDEILYPYDLIALAFVSPASGSETDRTTVARAKAAGQELLRRMRETIRSRPALGGITADDGETVQDVRITGRQRIQVRGHTAQIVQNDAEQPVAGYLAAASLSVEIRSSI